MGVVIRYTYIYKLYKSSNKVYIHVCITIYKGIYRLYRSNNKVYIYVYIGYIGVVIKYI